MASDMQHRIRRLFGLVILAFLGLLGWQSYWHLGKSDWLMAQPTNRRLSRAERNTPRGTIYDRAGTRIAWTEDGKRRYADSRATAAVLGYMDPVYGRTGVEGIWNLEMAGLSATFGPDDLHRMIAREKPHGKDLVLTLDLDLQEAAAKALQGKRGAIAVLDPATGGILALATSPTFDSSTIRADYQRLATADDGALRNRATQEFYPPGSTMKVVTAAAALMHGVDPDTTYHCEGKTDLQGVKITDYHGTSHGTVDMAEALKKSCNFYFASTAAHLGKDDLAATARAFGFDTHWWTKLPNPRMLPLPVAESSLAPDLTRHVPLGELAQMGFGQATVVATPLQMAMVGAAVANDGTLMAPYLVQEVRKGGTDETLQSFASVPIGFPLNADAARRLAGMMRGVVTGGTGGRANIRGITVYGKTGTAQQRGGADHAWFMGFARKDDGAQQIAFAVVIERGGGGGSVAAPVAARLLQAWKTE